VTYLLKPSFADKRELARILSEHLDTIEPGIEMVERNLKCPHGDAIDIVACDATGRAVLLDVGESDDPARLARSLAHFDWFVSNADLLERAFSENPIDVSIPPRLILASSSFSDELLRGVRHLTFTSVWLVQARVCDVNGNKCLDIETVVRSAEKRTADDMLGKLRGAIEEVPIGEEELAAFAQIQQRRAVDVQTT